MTKVGGKRKEWDAEIVEQVPEERLAWRSTTGTPNAGIVNFRPKDHNHTLVTLQMSYEPESTLEKLGDTLGLLSRRVENDLKHFRDFIHHRRTETGAWRGEIPEGKIKPKGSY